MGSINTQMQTPNSKVVSLPVWHAELAKVLTVFRNGFPSKLASLTRRVGKGFNGIPKWVPFTPKCSQKRCWLGLRSRPSNSEAERIWRLPARHAELKVILTLFKNGFHLHPNALRSVGGWGSAPDPPIVRESAFGACQSDTPSWKWY